MIHGRGTVVFPSSSSLNGHPGRPGERAAGGRGRPGARGPGRGPTVVWAQPGCLGAFSCRAPPRSRLEIGWLLTFVVTTDHERVCYCAPPVRLLHRRPPPKGRASRAARAAERMVAAVGEGLGDGAGEVAQHALRSGQVARVGQRAGPLPLQKVASCRSRTGIGGQLARKKPPSTQAGPTPQWAPGPAHAPPGGPCRHLMETAERQNAS